MNTTPHPDDEVTRRYRDASDELGEAPSAAARAAILAAAARQVQSRPADALNTAKRPARSFARWPLGAAAAVLLSTLAVLMADRTEREIATELASSRADSAPEAWPEAAKPVPSAPPVASAQDPKGKQGKAIAEAQQPALRREEAPRIESRSDAPAATATARQGGPTSPAAPVAKSITPASPPPAAVAPPPEADAAAAKAMADSAVREQDRGLSSSAPAAPSAIGQLRKNERERAAAAPMPSAESPAAPASTMAGAGARDERKVETSAAAWLERIIELRRKGEDEQADAELKKFLERYPEVVIPPQAQRAIGTR